MSSKIAADSKQTRTADQATRVHQQSTAAERDRFEPSVSAARLWREKTELEARLAATRSDLAATRADLATTRADLAASRTRLVDAAYAERQRIERDLHDSVQQQLVGVRIKLELASEEVAREPAGGRRMIDSIGRQMDEVLETLRSLARGIYPAVLHERGLGEALKSAGRRSPAPVSVRVTGIGRQPGEVEIAVYFSCLEAMQNVAKHAGRDTEAVIRLWRDSRRLWFEVTDRGRGFDPDTVPHPNGLVNMRDRIEAVGGMLTITSSAGHGCTVRGWVPTG
jgi:signal transduction histidine kinase